LSILYSVISPVSISLLQDETKGVNDQEETPLFPSLRPSWTEIGDGQLRDNGNRSSGMTTTRQEALNWIGSSGPEVYRLVYQIHFLYSSVYITLLLLFFYPYMFREKSMVVAAVFVLLSLLPCTFLLTTLRQSTANLVMVCNIGIHRKPQTIAQVLRQEKTDRVIRSLVLIQKLQYMATSSKGFIKEPQAPVLSLSQQLQLLNAKRSFDAIDRSGQGQIKVSELTSLMESLGCPITDESFQTIIKILDPNQSGIITLNEFSSFYQHNVLLNDDETRNSHKSLKKLAQQIFSQFDRNNRQSIALSEFKSVLQSFNVDFNVDELGELVNEIDHDNTGFVGVHELEGLLENHRHLFQTYRLPPFPIGFE
jgi:Ca2+-binding EF-hand superfamily protein